MLLQFLGVDITVDEFIEKYLEKQDFEERDGELFGPDPREYFCGSPYDEDSFGCYAPVIAGAMKRVLGGTYTVKDESGTDTAELLRYKGDLYPQQRCVCNLEGAYRDSQQG